MNICLEGKPTDSPREYRYAQLCSPTRRERYFGDRVVRGNECVRTITVDYRRRRRVRDPKRGVFFQSEKNRNW